jgi:hypothetical protein
MPARKLWREYGTKALNFPYFLAFDLDGVIYLVDSADPDRFEQAKKELETLLPLLHERVRRGVKKSVNVV